MTGLVHRDDRQPISKSITVPSGALAGKVSVFTAPPDSVVQLKLVSLISPSGKGSRVSLYDSYNDDTTAISGFERLGTFGCPSGVDEFNENSVYDHLDLQVKGTLYAIAAGASGTEALITGEIQ